MKGNEFQVHVVLPTGPAGVSPEAACKWDPEAFLRFAEKVMEVAYKETARIAQPNIASLLGGEVVSDIAAG